jgi:DNA repair protein RadD
MGKIFLYPDQEEFIGSIRSELRAGKKSVLGVASTGFGKTIVSAFIVKSSAERGRRVWFACHRKNLLKQTSLAFWKLQIQHGLIAAGKMQTPELVQVATIGSLVNRIGKIAPPDILILDECHLAMAPSWLKVIDYCKSHGAIIFGNSATPQRLDGKGLGYIFDSMVEARPMHWLIENKRLSSYKIYAPVSTPDMTGAKIVGGDYSASDAERIMDKPTITGDAAAHWLKYANGLRTICYCASIKHSRHTANQFSSVGIPAIHVDGESSDEEITDAINGFADGRYKVLCNVQLMTEGFDLSAQVNRDVPIEACILLRPTQSIALYMQMTGRALRMKPKPAIILDHAGCYLRHGLPDDQREWTLESLPKKQRAKREDEVTAKQCPACFAVFRAGPTACPSCGQSLTGDGRVIHEVAGELTEVDLAAARKEQRREQGAARTLTDLVQLGIRRGQRKPAEWAAIVNAARQGGRKPSPDEFKRAKDIYSQLQGSAW